MFKRASLSGLAALFSLVVAAAATAQDAKFLREANDRAEIQALMWRYVRALDTLDVDAYVAVFTEDAQFGNSKGREGIRQLISGVKAGRERNLAAGEKVTPTYQSITNMTIQFQSETTATVEGYYFALFGAQGTNPPRVATAGVEKNEVVKVGGQWLIKVRTVSP